MKAYSLLVILFLICGLEVQAQVNMSVRAARCSPFSAATGTFSEVVDLSSTENCLAGNVKLYYQFYAKQTTGGTPNVGTWTVSIGTFSYNVYGPFSSLENAYTQVETGIASPRAYGSASSSQLVALGGPINQGEIFIVEIVLSTCYTNVTVTGVSTSIVTCSPPALTCDDCLGQFQPTEGKYVFSAWTKEVGAEVTKTSYTFPSVEVKTIVGMSTTTIPMTPVGDIIDGWQQITDTFSIPAGMTAFRVEFIVGGSGETALFDDIRIFPFDGSMMSYVYDPVTLRLVAELDERNYAKLYEYDEEGKLVRVKKETEKGILTIMENRENSVKKP